MRPVGRAATARSPGTVFRSVGGARSIIAWTLPPAVPPARDSPSSFGLTSHFLARPPSAYHSTAVRPSVCNPLLIPGRFWDLEIVGETDRMREESRANEPLKRTAIFLDLSDIFPVNFANRSFQLNARFKSDPFISRFIPRLSGQIPFQSDFVSFVFLRFPASLSLCLPRSLDSLLSPLSLASFAVFS